MKRNYAIEFYRILFTAIICMHHIQGSVDAPLMKRSYLGVELFFVLSGYFLYRSFEREAHHSLRNYIQKRVLRLYPEYIIAFIPCVIISPEGDEFSFSRAFSEIFMLQNSGYFSEGGYNYPCWYVSVLVIGGILLYQALTVMRVQYVKLWGPIFALLVYSYLLQNGSGLENWGMAGPIYLPLIRGIAGMTLGILVAAVGTGKGDHIIIGSIAELGSLFIIFSSIFYGIWSENVTIIAIVVLVYVTVYRQGVISRFLNFKVLGTLGTISYPMYLSQAFFIAVFIKVKEMFGFPGGYWWQVLLLGVLFVCAFILHYMAEFAVRAGKKLTDRIAAIRCGV